jgi:hypothetical protein
MHGFPRRPRRRSSLAPPRSLLGLGREDWLAYKRERREGYKPTGLKALHRSIERMVADRGESAVIEMIYRAMASGWKGFDFGIAGHRRPHGPSAGEVFDPSKEGLRHEF